MCLFSTHINTLLQRHSSRETNDCIAAFTSILKEIREHVPDLGVVGRRAVVGNPFANQPSNAPFDNRITKESLLSVRQYENFRPYLEFVSRDSGTKVVSSHCSNGISSFNRDAQRPMAQYMASFCRMLAKSVTRRANHRSDHLRRLI